MSNIRILPEMINIPKVLTFDKEYLSARQPRVGFARPNATPLTRADACSFAQQQKKK